MRPLTRDAFSDLLDGLTFDRLASALFFVMVATIACLMPVQNDTWWQLRAGQDFWETGSVVLEETYSHTAAGRFWMNHEWLSEAIFYALFQLGNLPLLVGLAVLVAVANIAVTWALMRGSTMVRLLLWAVALSGVSRAWTPRPHVFTLLLVSITAWLIVERRHRWLPVVFLVWANLHGGFTLGVGLLGAFWLTGLTSGARTILVRSVIAAVCLLATLVTPLGVRFWEELPASLSRLQAYEVQEWQAATVTNPEALPFWLSLAALVGLLYIRRRTLFDDPADRFLIVASVLFIPLALTSMRNIPPFLVLALPTISRLLRIDMPETVSPLPRSQTRIHAGLIAGACIVAVAVVAVAWSRPLPRLQWNPLSAEVIAAVDACEDPIYNSYDDGGFLIWFLPHRKVFLDSRQDPYPVELIQQDTRAQFEAEYRDMFDTNGIRCAFVRSGVPLDRRLQADGWQPRYRDAVWTVLEPAETGR